MMNKFKASILLALSFWISDIPAVDLSGITPADMQLFFNYLILTVPVISTAFIAPLALYYSSQFIVSSIYSMFSR